MKVSGALTAPVVRDSARRIMARNVKMELLTKSGKTVAKPARRAKPAKAAKSAKTAKAKTAKKSAPKHKKASE